MEESNRGGMNLIGGESTWVGEVDRHLLHVEPDEHHAPRGVPAQDLKSIKTCQL